MQHFVPELRQLPVDYDPFIGPAIERTIPTTEAQREVIAASEMGDDANCAYVESISLILTGELDRSALELALQDLVGRHESLRSVIAASGTRMVVLAVVTLPISFHDLSALSVDEREKQLASIAEKDMTTPFDLLHGPLFRVVISKMGPLEHVLRMSGHHAVLDGWSLGILMAEISALYNAHHRKEKPDLPPAIPFSTYVLASTDFAKSPEQATVENYWADLFQGAAPRLDLPTDRPRPKNKTFHGERQDLPLRPELVTGLKKVATRTGTSFVTILLAAFEVLLHKLTGSNEIVTGLPAAGQSDLDMKHLVGHCVNLLALRSTVDDEASFESYLKGRRTALLDAYDHQKYTFGTLLRKLNVPREPGRIPLVPVVFNIDMNMDDGVVFDGLAHRFVSNPRRFENFELFLNATGSGDKVVLEWSYNTDLFDAATMRDRMDEFSELIERIGDNASLSIATLLGTGMPEKERSMPLAAWHGVKSNIPRDRGVDSLFEEVVKAHGADTALISADGEMTYSQLHTRVLSLAKVLQDQGVQQGDRVGLCTVRCTDMVASMLAILRCGAAYVPFDPGYPAERLSFMFRDAELKFLVTQRHLRDALPTHDVKTLLLEDVQDGPSSTQPPLGGSELPAYIMYTSGSTGEPKGVVVPHRAIIRLVRDQDFLPFGPELIFLQLSNISFDASTLELWGALLNGARLVLQPQQKPTLQEIVTAIKKHGITTTWFTAGLFNLLVDEHLEDLRGLQHILTGGDVLSVPHVRRALKVLGPGVLINGYGPTENTTFTCCHAIDEEPALSAHIPIGRPIHNTTVHILDAAMNEVRTGEKGELYTGGDGVALGYWHRPDLTAERFVNDPFSTVPGAKLYRTGDLARWLADGTIDFLGRADNQVKVRGFRVEPEEIESVISGLATVKDRAVIVRSDMPGGKQLVAYLVPADLKQVSADNTSQEDLIASVRKHLRASLPEHMVPTVFMLLPELPLTANGKLDKRSLPMPRLRAQTLGVKHVPPRDPREEQLVAIWSELLGVPPVGIHDNFFDLGGHSLIGIQLLAKVEEQFGKALPLNSLFQAPTVAAFAELMASTDTSHLENLAAIQTEGDRIPFFCVHGDEANHHITRYLGKEQPYYAFFHQGEDGSPFKYKSVEDIAAHYIDEMTTVRPHGPYLLGGYSFGGIVAYEMALQLVAAGEEVPLLAMFDMYAPDRFMEVLKKTEKLHEPLKRALIKRLVRRELEKHGRIRSPMLRHYNIIGNYINAIQSYHPGRFPGAVTIFKAERSAGPDDMGWSKLVHGAVDVHILPGDHYSLIKDPEVSYLVNELSASIDKALRKHSVEAV